MKHMRDYSVVNWKDIFEYNELSETGLVLKSSNKTVGRLPSKIDFENKRIGYILTFDGKRWLVHRIIAIVLGNDINGKIIDHIDGNPFNNKKNNIRVVDQTVNTRNKKKQSNNTSGLTGIGFYKFYKQKEYVCATVKVNRKTKIKRFSILKLGLIPAICLAIQWRLENLRKIEKDGKLFSKRHGI